MTYPYLLKRVVWLCAVIMMTSGTVYAQFSYSVHFSRGDIAFGRDRGYDVVEMNGCGKMDGMANDRDADLRPGNPSLPLRWVSLALPANTRPYALTITSIITEPVEGVFSIIPQQPETPDEFSIVSFAEPDARTYAVDAFFPRESAGIVYSGAYHGIPLASVEICPLRYNPVRKQLELITRIDFTIQLEPHEYPAKKRVERAWFDDTISAVKRMVDNPGDVDRFAYVPEFVEKTSTDGRRKTATALPFYEYVVITSPDLAPAFDPFVRWMKRKGIDAGVVTVSDINAAYNDGDGMGVPASAGGSIRAYLREGYGDENTHVTDWVLLGGDETVIPVMHGIMPGDLPQYGIPTDLFYSEFLGDWDADSDGIFGESDQDSLNLIPDICVGRVPCNTVEEVRNWTEKTLKYAQYPGNGDGSYLRNVYSMISDGVVSDASISSLTDRLQRAGFSTHDVTAETPSDAPFDSVTNPQSGAQVIREMSQGYGICNWHCHGAADHIPVRSGGINGSIGPKPNKCGIFTLDSQDVGGDMYVSESGNGLDNMTNTDRYSVLYSLSCDVAAYDHSESLMEGWLFSSRKGGPLFLSNTRAMSASDGWNIECYFYDALAAGSTQAGKAFNQSKARAVSRKLAQFTHNLFGDPELAIWTATPSRITPTIAVDDSSVTIAANLDSCTIAVSSYDFSTSMVRTGVPSCTFTTSVRPLYIVITKQNHLPYIAVTGGTLTENQTWGEEFTNLTLLGDITVPSSITLTVHAGTTVTATGEGCIHVDGTLATGADVFFAREPDASAAWDGIGITEGGLWQVNGDVAISGASTGVTIHGNPNPISNGTSRITVSDCTRAAVRVFDCSPSLHDITIPGTQGSGIFISGGSPDLRAITISSASNGGGGIYVSSGSPSLRDVSISGCESAAGVYAWGALSEPVISGTGIDGGYAGVLLGNYSAAEIHFTAITGCEEQCISGGGSSYLFMDAFGDGSGYNTILPPASVSQGSAIMGMLGTVEARNNYWGGIPNPVIFGDSVEYVPYLADPDPRAGCGKVAASGDTVSFPAAYALECVGDWPGAGAMYQNLFSASDDVQQKSRAIRCLIRVQDRSEKEYSSLRTLVASELGKQEMENSYREALDQITCELDLRAGDYGKAITGFLAAAETYSGTAIQVDMLVRVAEIYGNHYKNTATAKMYADEAAVLNAGALCLHGGYEAAGIMYNPLEYEDVFAPQIDSPVYVSAGTATVAEEYVTAAPNPANPVVVIRYFLRNTSKVKLSVYAVNGQKVATLVNGPVSAGMHAVSFDGSKLASGIYFYRFESLGMTKAGKMMFLK